VSSAAIAIASNGFALAVIATGYVLNRRSERKRRARLAQIERDDQWHT
jgi:hypothetical protein